jgi:major membrane immunogen (membrane-anchored lipoprotein)
MKNQLLNYSGILTLAAGLITSCSSSDNPTPTTPHSTFTADANNFQERSTMV